MIFKCIYFFKTVFYYSDSAIETNTPRNLHDLFSSHQQKELSLALYQSRNDHLDRSSVLNNSSSSSIVPSIVANFSQVPAKTAHRKEISKLRKRVMFSDDLSISHSGCDFGDSDNNTKHEAPFARQCYNRTLSADMQDGNFRPNNWLRGSTGHLNNHKNLQRNSEVYNQLPSNQIKSNSFKNKPLGDNLKGYLSKIMSRPQSNSDSTPDLADPPTSSWMTPGGPRSRSFDSDTTMSGSFHVPKYSLSSEGQGSNPAGCEEFDENVFSNEFDV